MNLILLPLTQNVKLDFGRVTKSKRLIQQGVIGKLYYTRKPSEMLVSSGILIVQSYVEMKLMAPTKKHQLVNVAEQNDVINAVNEKIN